MVSLFFLQAAMAFNFILIIITISIFILSLIFSWIYYLKKNWKEEFSWKMEVLQLANIFKIAFALTLFFIGVVLMFFLIWSPDFM